MPKVLDRVLLGLDGVLLAGVVALGVLGDVLPLPKGADTLVLTRPAAEEPSPAAPSVPVPAPPAPAASAVPAPVPAPAPEPEPARPKAPGQDEWSAAMGAKGRGMEALARARAANAPDQKRAAYAEAKKAFKQALAGIEAYRKVCPAENPGVDAEERNVNMLIFECNKSSPIELHP